MLTFCVPDNVFVATFMGEANHVRGTLDATGSDSGIVTLDGLRLTLPLRALPSGPVDVVIRPEAARLVEADITGCLSAGIRTATYMGAHAEYTRETAVGPLFVIAPEADRLRKPGAAVGVTLDGRGVFAVKP